MFNSKFDIYSSEWIERVFENRNKSYGAYDIRKHYAANLLRAFGIMLLVLAGVVLICLSFNTKPVSVNVHKGVDVVNRPIYVVTETPVSKSANTQAASSAQSKQQVNTATERATIYHTSVQSAAVEPVAAKPATPSASANTPGTNTPELQQINDVNIIDNDEADIKPAPIGGAEAWSRFLEVNLHYPAEAKKNRISGKVWVSFIVERDGHLSNIVVEHAAGHGFDEEAVRVLKLSPVWATGQQNGQAVRVKYMLPINFHIEHI